MFAVDCPKHGATVLLSEKRIASIVNTDRGILVELVCYDGERIVLLTGRRAGALAGQLA